MHLRSVLLFLVLSLLFSIGFCIRILNTGWVANYTEGTVGSLSIGMTKSSALRALLEFDHVTAVYIGNETYFFSSLAQSSDGTNVSIKLDKRASEADLWKFSPNVGHLMFEMMFEDGVLVRVIRTRYFL